MNQSILIRPLVTEKSMKEAALGRFSFEVGITANKTQIVAAVAQAFKVKTTRVQTITVPGEVKRDRKSRKVISGSKWKKAIVTLSKGEKIELFDVTEQQESRKVGQ